MSPHGKPPELGEIASAALKAIPDPNVMAVLVVSAQGRTAVASGHVPTANFAATLLIDGLARLLHAGGADVDRACELLRARMARIDAGIGENDSFGPWDVG